MPSPTLLRVATAALALLSLSASAQMLTDQAPPLHRIVHKNTLAGRINPLGLIYDGRWSYRLRLYESDSKALRDNFIGIGLAPSATPAFVRLGPYIEFNPLSVIGVWATIQAVQYFGTFGLGQSFPGAQSDFSDSAIRAQSATHQVTNGWDLILGATFQVKLLDQIIIKSQARLVNAHLNIREGDRIFYEQFYDVGAPNDGWYFTNDFDLLWQGLGGKLTAGARYTATAPFYDPAKHYDPDAAGQPVDNSMHRVGPFVGYTFWNEDGARVNCPTVFLLVQWWVKHRFRTGQDTPQALPLLGLGFQITGDFLPVK